MFHETKQKQKQKKELQVESKVFIFKNLLTFFSKLEWQSVNRVLQNKSVILFEMFHDQVVHSYPPSVA